MGNPNPKVKWQKGQSGNPRGSSRLSRTLGDAKKLTQDEFIGTARAIFHMPASEVQAMMLDPTTPAYKLLIASIVGKGIKHGDANRMSVLMDRIFGKVKENVHLTTESETLEKMTDEELEQYVANKLSRRT